ncbi:tRNA dimethylallyltransferase [Candidatus Planktophila dulcis]|uniref:tRNA (adenosine(37)-N6)-dimethylallyltransferase MiaA n=1 Tax=Candidatus Planktophila dulcis TaxID=1884914 RepID=UPI000BAC4FFC|nr:tRNA (adenosine(37)-N6)-dimethylallyltransferase MiaA [Candidatus Planktophila dulcis]ASY14737.1 tRNA dimethylallyltransferase [Candidatus Planktophila dulcis]
MSKVIVICGATATGKSDIAIEVAQELGAEIINADSMQLYRGMDIGTAKLTVEERKGFPHHLLDVLDVSEDSTVAWYQEQARAAITEIHGRGKDAVIVGGTGLYIKAILDDLNFPDTDPEVRAKLEAELAEFGAAALFTRLEELDPAAALAIDRANSRRVIRALEVIEITGLPFTANLPREDSSRYPDALQFGLVMDREHLRERIDQRVDRMWDAGFVDEVDRLISQGIGNGSTAQRALGYAQIIAMRSGAMTEEEAKEDTKRASRQYARRQETWFSRDARIQWVAQHQPRLETILQKINS